MENEGHILLKEELTLLRKVDEFRDHTFLRMDKLRDRIDSLRDAMVRSTDHSHDRIEASRNQADRRFNEMHAEMVHMQRSHEKLIYWVVGFTITNLVATAGWIMKAAGVF